METDSNIKKTTIDTYDNIAQKYDKEFCEDLYFADEFDFFLKQLPKGATIIDVGCGTGHLLKYCEEMGFKTFGIDLSVSMLNIARVRCINTEFKKADVENYDYGAETFDGIIASFILIHIHDIRSVLRKWFDAMRQGGYIFISVIEGEGEEMIPEPLNPSLKMYFRYVKEDEIKNDLRNVGFRIVKFDKRDISTEHLNQKEFFITARKQHI